jgi:hypothetical protein
MMIPIAFEPAERAAERKSTSTKGRWRETSGPVSNVMENELKVLAENGREVATKINLLIGKLDFQHDLGDVLARCADVLDGVAGAEIADISDLTETIAPLDRQIFKLYTMVQERNTHREIIPASEESAAAPAETPKAENDEDLFADALF